METLSKYCQYLATCLWSGADEKFTYCNRDVFLDEVNPSRYEMSSEVGFLMKNKDWVIICLLLINDRLCDCGPKTQTMQSWIDLACLSRKKSWNRRFRIVTRNTNPLFFHSNTVALSFNQVSYLFQRCTHRRMKKLNLTELLQ